MKWWRFQKIKKEQLIVVFIIGLLLMVITIPTKESGTSKAQEEDFLNLQGGAGTTANTGLTQGDWQASSKEYVAQMEEQLKSCLEQMEGVGKVQVMITLKASTEQVLAKDKTTASSSENMEDESAANSHMENSEVTVFEETDNNLTPYVVKEVSPVVKGVFVVAQGGDNPVVKQNISDAIMALFSIESHKIMVVKMKEG